MAEALETYRSKRDFTKTKEPAGKLKRSKKGGARFVVHKHAARRLHYDLRLEHNGVLWSWAVTRGPSLDPAEKRLAVHVEDHPLDYGDFEGSIPKGEYGGGEVIVWDEGFWTPEMDADKALAKGHIGFELHGEKLSGTWHLVRLKPRRGEKADNWLLIKADDAAARSDGDILEEQPQSVKSGLTVEDIAAGRKPKRTAKTKAKRKTSKAVELSFVEPCLASLETTAPNSKDWIHEIKFDGYRMQAHLSDGEVRLFTRTGLDWSDRFGPQLASAVAELGCDTAILDGEVVVLDGNGASSFPLLQQALSERATGRLVYFLFDLLHLDGDDLRSRSLLDRKKLLSELIGAEQSHTLRYSDHFTEKGSVLFKHVCALGLEGIVSKQADSKYVSGRGRTWTKVKCTGRQEVVILGYLPSEKTGRGIRSLLVGYEDDGKLRYGGRVGTGFTIKSGDDLLKRLKPMVIGKPGFEGPYEKVRGTVWVRPELVAEIEFRSWTHDGILRHASYQGLREDKPAEEVVKEEPGGSRTAKAKPTKAAKPTKTAKTEAQGTPKTAVKLSNPDKKLWPAEGVTKLDLLRLCEVVWPRMEPYVSNRPLSLLRAPDGIEKQRFFQKHASAGMSEFVHILKDPKDGEDLLYIDSFDGLAALAQMGVVEVHIWGSKIDDLERPDQIIFDLDPDEGVTAEDVIAATLDVRSRLDEIGLENFVKPSGGKGFHVLVPLKPSADWDVVKTFAHNFAKAMEQSEPKRYTASLSKAARKGKIFIDYLRNGRGSTTVCAWSARAKKGATVSVPVEWKDVEKGMDPGAFSMTDMAAIERRVKAADPWADFFSKGRALKV